MSTYDAPTARFAASATVLWRDLGDEALLLDLVSEEYIGLDTVASRFWQLVSGGALLTDAVAAVIDEFDADEAVVRHDLVAFVDDLVAKGLLHRVGE
jgi:hypothetical protein